jgi:hypothetical protein
MKLQSAYSRGGRVLEGRGAYSKGALDSYIGVYLNQFGIILVYLIPFVRGEGGGGRVFMHNALRLFLF